MNRKQKNMEKTVVSGIGVRKIARYIKKTHAGEEKVITTIGNGVKIIDIAPKKLYGERTATPSWSRVWFNQKKDMFHKRGEKRFAVDVYVEKELYVDNTDANRKMAKKVGCDVSEIPIDLEEGKQIALEIRCLHKDVMRSVPIKTKIGKNEVEQVDAELHIMADELYAEKTKHFKDETPKYAALWNRRVK